MTVLEDEIKKTNKHSVHRKDFTLKVGVVQPPLPPTTILHRQLFPHSATLQVLLFKHNKRVKV